jgi:hypothetical protein
LAGELRQPGRQRADAPLTGGLVTGSPSAVPDHVEEGATDPLRARFDVRARLFETGEPVGEVGVLE